MKVIALIGLVAIEKIQLTVDLATYYTWQTDKTVTVIDNVSRLAIDPAQLSDEPLIRVKDELRETLIDQLPQINSDVVIVAVSEAAELDQLFISLDVMTETIADVDLVTVGLVDLRTCDCFPNLRVKLEDYADMHFLAPFNAEDIIGVIEGAVG